MIHDCGWKACVTTNKRYSTKKTGRLKITIPILDYYLFNLDRNMQIAFLVAISLLLCLWMGSPSMCVCDVCCVGVRVIIRSRYVRYDRYDKVLRHRQLRKAGSPQICPPIGPGEPPLQPAPASIIHPKHPLDVEALIAVAHDDHGTLVPTLHLS